MSHGKERLAFIARSGQELCGGSGASVSVGRVIQGSGRLPRPTEHTTSSMLGCKVTLEHKQPPSEVSMCLTINELGEFFRKTTICLRSTQS
jgi:hypothetical protein